MSRRRWKFVKSVILKYLNTFIKTIVFLSEEVNKYSNLSLILIATIFFCVQKNFFTEEYLNIPQTANIVI